MTIVSLVQRIMNIHPATVVSPKDVTPSDDDRDLGKEARLRTQQDEFERQYNRSVFLRRALANDVLRIVAGD